MRGSMRFKTLVLLLCVPMVVSAQARPRARDLGLAPGVFPTGRWNAIRCYENGGCTATGVSAPRRIERSSDGYVTYWRLW